MIDRNIYRLVFALLVMPLLMVACKKVDEPKYDDRLEQKRYCNDPDAVNYNVGFPGVADNSICYFPTALFKGTYTFYDSVLDGILKFKSVETRQIVIEALDNKRMTLSGFCKGTDGKAPSVMFLTADRYYKAIPDSTPTNGGYQTKLNGTILCREKDTLSGYIQKYSNDSNRILIRFTIATDTGFSFHFGTAVKQ